MNIFDDPTGTFVVLVNGVRQQSLWPESFEMPGGWSVIFGPDKRAECLSYISASWPRLRPEDPSESTGGR